ncbi:MAG: hypothetical protein EXQ86_03745 [Rhodospirillales bacterium]|nr:hypothetical protein [Rhodospirillales bacterium]
MIALPAGERRIVLGLGAACACLVVIAVLPWIRDPIAPGRPVKPTEAAGSPFIVPRFEAPPLAALSPMVERPLFTATRRPAPTAVPAGAAAGDAAGSGPILGRYRFNGVVVTPTVRMVFVTYIKDNKPVAIAEGEKLDEWVVTEVRGDMVVLRSGDREERVSVRDPPPAAAPGVPAPR